MRHFTSAFIIKHALLVSYAVFRCTPLLTLLFVHAGSEDKDGLTTYTKASIVRSNSLLINCMQQLPCGRAVCF